MDITSDRVLIGEGFSSSQEFEGCIEQVLIYREALTQYEIQTAVADYMASAPTVAPTLSEPTSTSEPTEALGDADFDETSDDCRWESTLDGDDLGSSSHSTIMKIDWTDATYSGSREWLLNLGQTGTGAEHWLWSGGSDIQIGVYNGGDEGNQIDSYDISSCTYLATTYDSSSYEYFRCADSSPTSRGDAAAATWIFSRDRCAPQVRALLRRRGGGRDNA